jgi:hypothetical protein
MGVLTALAALGLLGLGSAQAQEQPHVTAVVTGPTATSRGSAATYDIAINVDGPETTFVTTFENDVATGAPPDLCCTEVSATVVSGQAHRTSPKPAGPPYLSSIWWGVQGTGIVIRLVVAISESTAADHFTVGGYILGSDVAQFEYVTPVVTTITSLPATGGPPPIQNPHGYQMMLAGAALLLAAAACVVGARRLSPGEMP